MTTGSAVAFHGGKNGMWVLTGERERFCCIHIIGKSIRMLWTYEALRSRICRAVCIPAAGAGSWR